ncbi:MAG TPA: hypothetical protein VGY58_20715 [Gemmataceae bacterium]|nr:hypothetical protein [Gemmataceae bacterium]
MLPTSLAFGWMFWRRDRWGHLVGLGYLLIAGIVSAVLPAHIAPEMAPAVFVPLTLPIVWFGITLLATCSLGWDAPIGGRESCFPAELFKLPVRTGALAGWPMAYGAAAASLLWLAVAWLILRPWMSSFGGHIPLWWPAMLAMATLAWIQALLWLPFGLPWLRVLLMVFLFPGLSALAQYCVASGASEAFLVGLFAVPVIVAWTICYVAVRHARRGDAPNWEGLFEPFRRLARWLPYHRRPFASAASAQTWFEWRRSGNSLPFMTGLVLPAVLLFLAFGVNDLIPTAQTLLSALAVPVFVAGMAGATVSGKNPWVKDEFAMAPFTATLPMSTGELLAAKLKAAALSTLAAWGLVVVAVPVAVILTGRQEEVEGWWRQAQHQVHPVKIAAGMVAATTLLFACTWKQLVDSLFLGLTGRKWVFQSALVAVMAGFFILCCVGGWIYKHPETHHQFLALLPWLLGLLIVCRLLVAGVALRQGLRRGLLEPRTALRWLTAWVFLGSALFGLLAYVVPTDLMPVHYLAFAVLLAMPMTRLTAAPLALAWNRHR